MGLTATGNLRRVKKGEGGGLVTHACKFVYMFGCKLVYKFVCIALMVGLASEWGLQH